LGREVDHLRFSFRRRFRRGDRLRERLGEHHHTGTAPVRPVVDRAVVVGREIARVPQREAPQPLFPPPPRNAEIRDRREPLREERHAIEADPQPAPHPPPPLPAPRSIFRIPPPAPGRSRSPPLCSTRITSCAPALKNSFTRPRTSPR